MRSQRQPTIGERLSRHPDLQQYRHSGILWLTFAIVTLLIGCWVLLLVNGAELARELEALRETAVTSRQRFGAANGVLFAHIVLLLLVIATLILGMRLSRRWRRAQTGTPLRRRYLGFFHPTTEQAHRLYRLLSTRSAGQIGTLETSARSGRLKIEAWAAEADRVGYAGMYSVDEKEDPGWEIVIFAGDDFSDFDKVFPRAVQPEA